MMENAHAVLADTGREFAFSERDFQMISGLANARYGLFLQPSKKALVHSRLSKRLRALNLDSFEDYCDLLERPEGASEQSHLLSALTTNVTHFFREAHHFGQLKEEILPVLKAKAEAGDPVRLWSAACSSGQEAYSIAATLIAGFPEVHRHDVKILATDIDPQVIRTARAGIYPSEQISAIPTDWQTTFTNGRSPRDKNYQMEEKFKSLISFGELNLIADWPMTRQFDVILCRNAAIYFDKDTQSRLWQRFADALTDGGYLMIGHSERLSGPSKVLFKSAGITSYQRKNRRNGDEK